MGGPTGELVRKGKSGSRRGEMSDEREGRAWSGTKGDCLRCGEPENDPSRARARKGEQRYSPGEHPIWIKVVTGGYL